MTTESPTPPSPKTTTPSPGRTRAVFSTAPTPVETQQPMSAAAEGSMSSGTGTAATAGTTVAWANVPRPRYGRTSVASPRRSRVEPSGNRLVRAALPEHSHCRPA